MAFFNLVVSSLCLNRVLGACQGTKVGRVYSRHDVYIIAVEIFLHHLNILLNPNTLSFSAGSSSSVVFTGFSGFLFLPAGTSVSLFVVLVFLPLAFFSVSGRSSSVPTWLAEASLRSVCLRLAPRVFLSFFFWPEFSFLSFFFFFELATSDVFFSPSFPSFPFPLPFFLLSFSLFLVSFNCNCAARATT